MDRPDSSSAPSTSHDSDNKNIKLPSFSSLFASIQPPQPPKPQPTQPDHRSGWTALTEAASAEYSHSAPSPSPWLNNNRNSNNSPAEAKPTPSQQQQNIRLPPIHLVSPSGGYLHPLPSGLTGAGGGPGLPISSSSRGPRSPPASHRKRSNSLTGHPYAYAPTSRSTYEPPPVVTDLGRRPSLGNFNGYQQTSQVGPSGLSRRARIQSRSPPRDYGVAQTRGRPGSPTQPRAVDYASQSRGRSGSQSEEHRPVMAWDREGLNHRSGGTPHYSSPASPAPGSTYSEPYGRAESNGGSYYSHRSNNVASDLSQLHISQADSYRPLSSHGPLLPMHTAPPSYPHPPRSQPQNHMPPPPSRGPPPPGDPNGARNGGGAGWTSQPLAQQQQQQQQQRGAYGAAEANPHAVPVGASAPPEVGRYACPHCPKRFARPSSLRIHIHSHTGEKPFACPHCHRGFSVQSNLRRHLKIHRSNGVVTAEESEGGGSMSDEDGSEEQMEVVG